MPTESPGGSEERIDIFMAIVRFTREPLWAPRVIVAGQLRVALALVGGRGSQRLAARVVPGIQVVALALVGGRGSQLHDRRVRRNQRPRGARPRRRARIATAEGHAEVVATWDVALALVGGRGSQPTARVHSGTMTAVALALVGGRGSQRHVRGRPGPHVRVALALVGGRGSQQGPPPSGWPYRIVALALVGGRGSQRGDADLAGQDGLAWRSPSSAGEDRNRSPGLPTRRPPAGGARPRRRARIATSASARRA